MAMLRAGERGGGFSSPWHWPKQAVAAAAAAASSYRDGYTKTNYPCRWATPVPQTRPSWLAWTSGGWGVQLTLVKSANADAASAEPDTTWAFGLCWFGYRPVRPRSMAPIYCRKAIRPAAGKRAKTTKKGKHRSGNWWDEKKEDGRN